MREKRVSERFRLRREEEEKEEERKKEEKNKHERRYPSLPFSSWLLSQESAVGKVRFLKSKFIAWLFWRRSGRKMGRKKIRLLREVNRGIVKAMMEL